MLLSARPASRGHGGVCNAHCPRCMRERHAFGLAGVWVPRARRNGDLERGGFRPHARWARLGRREGDEGALARLGRAEGTSATREKAEAHLAGTAAVEMRQPN